MKFETTSLPAGVQDEGYSATIEASGGTEEGYTWSVKSGSLPDGLELRGNGTPSTRLSGTLSAAGSFTFTVEVTDSRDNTGEQAFTVEVAEPPPELAITTADVPNGGTDVEYSAEIIATGGSGDGYRWRVSNGTLPAGLTLAEDGTPSTMLAGTPPAGADGDYEFTVTVTDSANNRATMDFAMNVQNNVVPLNFVTQDIPDGEENFAYSATLEAEGGKGEYSWRVQGGELPPGLTLDESGSGTTTTIEGTPNMSGNFTFQIEVRDEDGDNARKTIFMEIAPEPPPVRIVTTEIDPGEENTPYEATIRAINGSGEGYMWSIDEGQLPAGLTIGAASPMGSTETTISGTPTEFGTFDFTVVVTDSRGNQDDQQLTLSIQEEVIPIQIVGDTNGVIVLPNAVGGEQYSATIEAQDGFGNYNWVAQGLPPGVRLQVPGTPGSVFSGLPQALGTFTATVTVYDLNNDTDSVQVQITVDPPNTLPTITTSALPAAPICGAYARQITGTGGSNANYTWSVQGNLPPGFVLDPTGTPATTLRGTSDTTTGTYNFTVTLTDTFGLTDTQAFTLDVADVPGGFRFVMHMGDVEASGVQEIYINEVCGTPSTTPTNVTVPNAPSGGDVLGSTSSGHFYAGFSPNGESLAYIGDLTTDNTYDVYVVDLRSGTPSAPILVSGGLGFSGSLSARYIKYSPDGTKLSILADVTTSGADELFVVDLSDPASPGQGVRVSQQFTSSANDVTTYDWWFSPDGTKIVFEADPVSSEQRFWYVDLSGLPTGGAPTAPVSIHDVAYSSADSNYMVHWTPDSRGVVYSGDFSGSTSEDNVYWVDLSGPTPGTPIQLNPELPLNADCYVYAINDLSYTLQISPDGSKVVMLCEGEQDNARYPFIVDISGTVPGPAVKAIDLAPMTNRYVTKVRWSPDSTHIVFYGDLGPVDNADELYMADVSGALPAPLQTIAPTTSTSLEMYTSPYFFAGFSPDMQKVFYIGDFDTSAYYELYQVTVGNGPPYQRVKVHPPFTQSSQDVYNWKISPDGNKIAVTVYESSAYNLFVADISGPVPTNWARAHSIPASSSADLTGDQSTGWDGGWDYFWTPDSQSLVFSGALATSGADEMWISDVSGAPPYTEQRLSVPNSNTSLDVWWTWAQGEYALPYQFQRP
ncbi:MAG: putative Ig domain-containing protein [Deltaproteobacteria bacterium]